MKDNSLLEFFHQTAFAPGLSDSEKAKLESYVDIAREPIFIKILVGAGAWLASVFIMVFIGASDIVGDEMGAVALGLVCLLVGLAIKKIGATFATQMSLALVSTAHILIIYGAVNIYDRNELTVCLIIHAALVILIYPLYSSAIYRFLGPLTTGLFAFFWILDKQQPSLFHLLVLCQVCCIALFFQRRKWSAPLRPLAHSGLFLLPTLFMLNHANYFNSFGSHTIINTWPSTIIVAMGLILLICHFSTDWRSDQTTRAAILITILLSLFTTPAIIVAVGLFILGHGLQKTAITILAYGYMPLSLTSYYYFLGVDLAQKSWIMMASGLLLLGSMFLLKRIQLPREEQR